MRTIANCIGRGKHIHTPGRLPVSRENSLSSTRRHDFYRLARAFKHGVYIGSTGTVPIARIFIEWGLQSVQLGYRAVLGFRLTKDRNRIYPRRATGVYLLLREKIVIRSTIRELFVGICIRTGRLMPAAGRNARTSVRQL